MAISARAEGILNRLSPDSQSARLGHELVKLWEALAGLQQELAALTALNSQSQEFFCRTVRIEPGSIALTILDLEKVKPGRRAYPLGFILALEGDIAWTGENAVQLRDTGSEPYYRFFEIPGGILVPNTSITMETEGIVLDDEFVLGLGTRECEGLALSEVGEFTAGSPARLTIYGYCQ